MEPRIVPSQSSASSLSGRTAVQLPAAARYRKGWEILGVEWLESLDEEPFLAKALLPEGWTTQRDPTLYSDNYDITLIDSTGQERVKIWIQTAFYDRAANVSFLKIDRKLPEQPDEKESEATKEDFKPICYPGYYSKFYCSYNEIVSAIDSWGKVEAILMAGSGFNHIFIVRFKKPIRFSSYEEGIPVNLTGGHGIWYTPFTLRGMYSNGSSCHNAVLSNNMIAFDIRCLQIGCFSASDLWESQRLLPDERLRQIDEDVGPLAHRKRKEKSIDSIFSESDRAKKLLEWIKQSGLSILEKGLYRSGDDTIGEYPIDEIVENYTTLKSFSPWQVVMKAEN